jgi:hypothetical protein
MNDNKPRQDGNRLMADANWCYTVSHIYLVGAGIIFSVDGPGMLSALGVVVFVLLTMLGKFHAKAALDAFAYDECRSEYERKDDGANSWPA